MAKFLCVCGETIRTSGEIPHPYQWELLSDVVFESFGDEVRTSDVYMAGTIMFRCPASGHLWIYWDGFDQDPTLYAQQAIPDRPFPVRPPKRNMTEPPGLYAPKANEQSHISKADES